MSYKQCRILNKDTNEIFFGQIDTELEGQSFYEFVEIPDDRKIYIYSSESPYYVEDAEGTKGQLVNEAKMIRDKNINEITNAKLLDDLQLDAGQITQAVHDARKTARIAQLAEVQATFYTTTGLTQPTTITA